jgi:hypothetical protein
MYVDSDNNGCAGCSCAEVGSELRRGASVDDRQEYADEVER